MRREKKIEVRVSYIEQKAIQLTADKVGLSVSDYVRKAALNKDVKMKFTPEQMEVYKDLHKYHVNFTRIGNIIRARGADAELIGEVQEVLKLITQHLKGFQE